MVAAVTLLTTVFGNATVNPLTRRLPSLRRFRISTGAACCISGRAAPRWIRSNLWAFGRRADLSARRAAATVSVHLAAVFADSEAADADVVIVWLRSPALSGSFETCHRRRVRNLAPLLAGWTMQIDAVWKRWTELLRPSSP